MDLDLATVMPVVWAGLVGASVALYVIMDGFDLGVGILFPFRRDEEDRDVMMNSVAPFWDGNETWLVLGGGALWVGFPLAYSIIMPALYVPIVVMLLALIFRGVAFEFRWVSKPNHHWWDVAFAAGSVVAAFAQGLVLAGALLGVRVSEDAFAGGPFDWFSPFALLCGFGLVAGYALLGATWLHMRVAGPVEEWARGIVKPLLLALLAFILVVSLWTPIAFDRIAERWFSWPNIALLSPVPVLTGLAALLVWRSIEAGRPAAPFVGSVLLFLLAFLGLAISVFPDIVPGALTIWEASAAVESQIFLGVGVAAFLPVVAGYTVFVYWTFRGRVRHGEGYH